MNQASHDRQSIAMPITKEQAKAVSDALLSIRLGVLTKLQTRASRGEPMTLCEDFPLRGVGEIDQQVADQIRR